MSRLNLHVECEDREAEEMPLLSDLDLRNLGACEECFRCGRCEDNF